MQGRRFLISPLAVAAAVAVALMMRSVGVPTGQDPTTTPQPAYLPLTFRYPADYKTSTPRPTRPRPVRECLEPVRLCPPCPGCTKTPEPGAGTPTVCPACRPR